MPFGQYDSILPWRANGQSLSHLGPIHTPLFLPGQTSQELPAIQPEILALSDCVSTGRVQLLHKTQGCKHHLSSIYQPSLVIDIT